MLDAVDRLLTASASLAYIAGPKLKDAVTVCTKFSAQGISSTVGYWDKGDDDDPRLVADAYLEALNAIHIEHLDAYISIKAPPLKYADDLLAEVVARARQTGIGVHFDSLFPEAADRTLELIADTVKRYARTGCTVPGRWRRSVDDAARAVELGVARIRVVKGQWEDPEAPKMDMRQGYLAVIDRLAGTATHVAVATHDPVLAQAAIRRLQVAGTSCEMELLYGLPMHAILRIAREHAVPVRLYVPYGTAYMPYALSQVRRNPRILWWYIRDTLMGSRRGVVNDELSVKP
ncbi:MAG: hypothetical protein ACFCUG_12430 [Thiotrichales bacterium]